MATALLLCQNPAQAVDVRLCDSDVESVISNLQRTGNKIGVDIWGKEYYTYQGARSCEVHFGNSRDNTVRFRLNDDNTVARALVTVQATPSSQAGVAGNVVGFILGSTGMNESEMKALMDTVTDKFSNASARDPYMTHYHEKTSIWSDSIQRYVVWDEEMNNTGSTLTIDTYLYAYK